MQRDTATCVRPGCFWTDPMMLFMLNPCRASAKNGMILVPSGLHMVWPSEFTTILHCYSLETKTFVRLRKVWAVALRHGGRGGKNSAFARGSGSPQFPGFPRIRGWRHPSLQLFASRDGDGGDASSQRTFFSWLRVVKVFKIKKNLLFATTVNRQQ